MRKNWAAAAGGRGKGGEDDFKSAEPDAAPCPPPVPPPGPADPTAHMDPYAAWRPNGICMGPEPIHGKMATSLNRQWNGVRAPDCLCAGFECDCP